MTEAGDAPEFDLRGRLRGVFRHRLVIAAVVLLSLLSAGATLVLQHPVYEGQVRILLQDRPSESVFASGSQQPPDPARNVQDEMEVIKSEPVANTVAGEMGPVSKVRVSQVGTTDVITVKGRSQRPARAAAIATAYASAYLDYRRSQAIQDLNTAEQALDAKINGLQVQISSLDTQINDALQKQLANALAQARAVNPAAPDPSPYISAEPAAGLTSQREQLLGQQSQLQQQRTEIDLDASLRSGGAQLVTTGVVPTFKVEPRPVRTVGVALVIGLVLGLGLALLLDYLDDAVRSKEDVDRLAPNVPTLGLVPVGPPAKGELPVLASLSEPSSPVAEAFRSLRTSLQFVGLERPPKVFQVTSPQPGEGKTTVVSNLGVVMARAGQRVVVVDCDLRRARLHDYFRLPNQVGFTSVLVHEQSLAEAIHEVPAVENLAVLCAGPLPPNPSELLSSRRAAEILLELQESYDVVLVDCPPVLPVADAVAISAWVDATLLTVGTGVTTKRGLRRTLELLRQAQATLVGAILNRVEAEDRYEYRYRYESDRHRRHGKRRAADDRGVVPVVGGSGAVGEGAGPDSRGREGASPAAEATPRS